MKIESSFLPLLQASTSGSTIENGDSQILLNPNVNLVLPICGLTGTGVIGSANNNSFHFDSALSVGTFNAIIGPGIWMAVLAYTINSDAVANRYEARITTTAGTVFLTQIPTAAGVGHVYSGTQTILLNLVSAANIVYSRVNPPVSGQFIGCTFHKLNAT